MEQAVTNFRTRMAAANKAFLKARISEHRTASDSEFQGISAMTRYWFRWTEEYKTWKPGRSLPEHAPDELKNQARLEAEVDSLDDVETLIDKHWLLDGTRPPAGELLRKRFLRVLEEVLNNSKDVELLEDEEERLELPAELAEFLSVTNGVFDADFRHSGMCDFTMVDEKCDEVEEHLRYRLDTVADSEEWAKLGADFLDDELEIVAGVVLDFKQQWPAHGPEFKDNTWLSMYAYCRRVPDQDSEEPEEDFSWRVVFYHRINDMDQKAFTFTSIAEFLGWYASWDERMNMEDMRRATSGYGPPNMDLDTGGYAGYD